MKNRFKKSGKKLTKRLSHFSHRAGHDTRDHIQENVIDRISHIKNVRLQIVEWVLLVVAIISLALVQSFWYSESYATEAYIAGGTYTEATLGTVKTLNPLFATSSSEETLSRLMFRALAAPDYSGHMGLDLASSITPDETGKIWTVKLRDNLKWSDGEPITIDDVLYTVNLIKDPNLNTNYTNKLTNVTVATQDDAIIFTLRAANAYFTSILDFPILPQHALKDVDNTKLLESSYSAKPTVTSAAFSFNASQAVGTEGEQIIYLTPNQYYGKGRPLVDSFVVHAFLTKDDIIKALNAGTVTASAEIESIDREKITNPALSERQSAIDYGTFAFINLDSPVMKSKELRQAVQKGLNLEELRQLTRGEQPLNYPIIEEQINLENWPALPSFDQSAARQEIAAWQTAHPSLTSTAINIATVETGYLHELADNLSKQLTDLGIANTVTVYEPNQDFTVNILSNRAYDILIYQVGLGVNPDLFPYYHSSQAISSGLNLSNYRDTISNDLILSARSTMDRQLRAKKYENFLSRWVDAVPAIALSRANLTYFASNNVRTFSSENALVSGVDRFNDVNLWASVKASKNRTP